MESNTIDLLNQYYLLSEDVYKSEHEIQDIKKFPIHTFIIKDGFWSILLNNSFDNSLIEKELKSKSDEELKDIFLFGIDCFLTFIQCNFTGPELTQSLKQYFQREMFRNADYYQFLNCNNEEANINVLYPLLLVAPKILFKNCLVNELVNNWWYWRSILIHQQIVEELSPTLLSEAEKIHKYLSCVDLPDLIKASLNIEIAQVFLLYHYINKARSHIETATKILGIHYSLVGKLGRRTRYQQKDVAQLTLELSIDRKEDSTLEVDDKDIPINVAINDEVRLDAIKFAEAAEDVVMGNIEQKLLLTDVQDMLLSRPPDELQREELQPFIDLILKQKNTFSIRIVALMIRLKLENKSSRTLERSLSQCEEIINSFKRENPPVLNRVTDVFSTGQAPTWNIEATYATLLLNIGLVKNSLDIFLKIKLWEEVIVCYTVLQLRHKAEEIIRQQLEIKPTVKFWCLLGDVTDDVECYNTAWEMSNKRSHIVQRHWGNFLFDKKQYAECIPHFEKSLSINPLQANIWFRLGFAALETENWTVATTAYRRYTTLEPESFEAWNNLAQAYIKLGNKRPAHQALLEALKCNFENWKVWENFLHISCDIGNYSDVIRAYHRILDIKKKYLNLNVLKYLLYNSQVYAEGEVNDKIMKPIRELFGRLTTMYPNEGDLWKLYTLLSTNGTTRAVRLQKAFKGYTMQPNWNQDPEMCKTVLKLCDTMMDNLMFLLEIGEIKGNDPSFNSARLSISSAVTAIKKHSHEEIKELLVSSEENVKKLTSIVKENMS